MSAPPSPDPVSARQVSPEPREARSRNAPRKSSSGLPLALGVAAVGLAVAAGVVGYKYLGKPRLSATPCGKGALALIGSLREPITITLFVTPGTPKMDRFIESMNLTMRDLEASSNGKLVYKLAPVSSDDVAREAKEMGLQEVPLPVSDDPRGPIVRAFCGIAFSYRSEREAIPVLDPENEAGLPFWIVNKIREIKSRGDDLQIRIGVVTSKGGVSFSEPSLVSRQAGGSSPNMKSIFTQAMPFYKLEDLDLKGGDAEIDSEYSGVIVLQPDTDYTDKELRRLDQFLMRGRKSLVVIASAVSLQAADPKMTASLSTHGLERLLDGYGIEMQKDILDDWAQPLQIPFNTNVGNGALRLSGGILVKHDPAAAPEAQTLDSSFIPFFRLDEVALPFASTLVLHPEKQPDARLRAVARTSPSATSRAAPPASLSPVMQDGAPENAAKSQRVLAAALDGKIHSAFAGRPGDGVSTVDVSPGESRLFVLSSSQFPVNPLARATNPPPTAPPGTSVASDDLALLCPSYAQKYLTGTILAVKNTLDWASLDEATVSCSALLMDSTKAAAKK